MGLIKSNRIGRPGQANQKITGVVKIEIDITVYNQFSGIPIVGPLPNENQVSGTANHIISLPWEFDNSASGDAQYVRSFYDLLIFNAFGRKNTTGWGTDSADEMFIDLRADTLDPLGNVIEPGFTFQKSAPYEELASCEDDTIDNTISTGRQLFSHSIYEGIRSEFSIWAEQDSTVVGCENEGNVTFLFQLAKLPEWAKNDFDIKKNINLNPGIGSYNSISVEMY